MHYDELVSAARERIEEIEPDDLAARQAVVVDVREAHEYALGAIGDSILIPRGVLEGSAATALPDRRARIVLVCESGARSALAAVSLESMGYLDVASLRGGFEAWKAAGLPWTAPETLSDTQRGRYSRHTMLSEVGEPGQQRLLEAKVLVIGAGGLGSPAAMYLAAAGVGTLGIVDNDVVDASNLQRQVIHRLSDVGRPKTDSARRTVEDLNPDVTVRVHPARLDASNALTIMAGYDVVVDGADNFPTRYLINDASLRLGIPVVHGSIFRFEGQATVFRPHDGPCYRCMFPSPPPPELAPNCAEAGVIGALPGVIGSIQALEAMKLILGIGTDLAGRLLTYDALEQHFMTLAIARDPNCPVCADPQQLPPIVDYDETCSTV